MGKKLRVIDAEFSIVKEAEPLKRSPSMDEIAVYASGLFAAAVMIGLGVLFNAFLYDDAYAFFYRLIWGS